MRDLARHLVRAGSVPKPSSKLTEQTPTTQRLDSWRAEATPKEAASDIEYIPEPAKRVNGRPVHAVEDRRTVKHSVYITPAESQRFLQYQKKRRISVSDAVRELILLGLDSLKSDSEKEKTPPRGGVTRP
jgi:hypothetical protein